MEKKLFTRKELENRNSPKDCVFVIDNVVFNVTKFLDEHPGGHEVLLEKGGTDGTEAFADIGHSSDARELMTKYIIGELVEEDRVLTEKKNVTWESSDKKEPSSFVSSILLPVFLGIVATVIYRFIFDY